jgi:hypothetical protein
MKCLSTETQKSAPDSPLTDPFAVPKFLILRRGSPLPGSEFQMVRP